MAHIFLSGGLISLVFAPKVILSFLLCLILFILIGCICFSVFLLSDYWWVVFSALNFQYWLVFWSKTRKRLVILSSSSLVHYSHSTFCLLYNFSKIQPSLKALSTQKKWPRIFYFHWLTTRKMLRSSKMAQYYITIRHMTSYN